MQRKDSGPSRKGFHQIIALDRLIKQGKTPEQANQHVRETPEETLRAENLAYLEQNQSS
mgnify:FL=1